MMHGDAWDALDRALDDPAAVPDGDMQELRALALDVGDAYAAWSLPALHRGAIHARVMARVDARRWRQRVARVRHVSAMVGGAAALAAATAIAVRALHARERRQRSPLAGLT